MGTAPVKSAEVRVEAGRTTVLELSTEGQVVGATGSVEISLVDEDGNPIQASPVYLKREGGTEVHEIVIDGGSGKIDNIVPGTYILSLQPIPASPDATTGADTGATGSYEINLKNSQGEPVPVGPVYLIKNDWKNVYKIEIDSSGHGARDDIVPGTYTVTLENKVTLEEKIYFINKKKKEGSHAITNSAAKVLDQIVTLFKTQATENIEKILCVGHASIDGSRTYNENLSIRRAAAVRDALEEKFKTVDLAGIVTLLKTVGMGEPENIKEVREEDRRVDIEVFFKTSGLY